MKKDVTYANNLVEEKIFHERSFWKLDGEFA